MIKKFLPDFDLNVPVHEHFTPEIMEGEPDAATKASTLAVPSPAKVKIVSSTLACVKPERNPSTNAITKAVSPLAKVNPQV